MLRTSGTFAVIIEGMKKFFSCWPPIPVFVEGLPTALVRPLSASGCERYDGKYHDHYGADSFPGRLSSIMQGSSDSTFYVVAVYFGAVAVKNTRYSLVQCCWQTLWDYYRILMAYYFW